MVTVSNTGTLNYFIQPVLGLNESLEKFKQRKGFLRSKKDVVKTECVYLPVYVFKILTEDTKKNIVQHYVCVDAIEGQFAFIDIEKMQKQEGKSGTIGGFLVAEEEAMITARSEFRLHLQRFKPGISIVEIYLEATAGYPYWIGYFVSKKGYSFDVLDACSGKEQGVKMQSLFFQTYSSKNPKIRFSGSSNKSFTINNREK